MFLGYGCNYFYLFQYIFIVCALMSVICMIPLAYRDYKKNKIKKDIKKAKETITDTKEKI